MQDISNQQHTQHTTTLSLLLFSNNPLALLIHFFKYNLPTFSFSSQYFLLLLYPFFPYHYHLLSMVTTY